MGERLSKDELDRWQQRIRHAKQVWVDKGLLGDQQVSTMRMLIEMHRGNQWAHLASQFGDLDPEDLVTVNKIFGVGNGIVGEIAARDPRAQLFARSREAQRYVDVVTALINSDIQRIRLKRQMNRALTDHLWAPLGLLRHGFTPREEMFDAEGRRITFLQVDPDRPWVRRIPIWNVLFDPDVEDFRESPWVAFRSMMTVDQIKKNPAMSNRDGLPDKGGEIEEDFRKMRPLDEQQSDEEHPDRQDRVEVYTVYEAMEQTWFQIHLDLDKALREKDDWPLPWSHLPVSILGVNEQMDTAMSLPILEQMIPQQVELNKVRTMMSQLVKRMRRLVGLDVNRIDEEERRKLIHGSLVEFFEMKGPANEAVGQVQIGGFAPDIPVYGQTIESDMREVVGQSRMARAERINVESATEANFVQQGQNVHSGRILDAFEDFLEDALTLYMQGRRAVVKATDQSEFVRIVGARDAGDIDRWAEVTPEAIAQDFDLGLQAGSTRREDKDQMAARAAADLQLASAAPEIFNVAFFARKYLEARGLDSEEAMNPEALRNAFVQGEAETLRQAQSTAPGQGGNGARPRPNVSPEAIAALRGQQ